MAFELSCWMSKRHQCRTMCVCVCISPIRNSICSRAHHDTFVERMHLRILCVDLNAHFSIVCRYQCGWLFIKWPTKQATYIDIWWYFIQHLHSLEQHQCVHTTIKICIWLLLPLSLPLPLHPIGSKRTNKNRQQTNENASRPLSSRMSSLDLTHHFSWFGPFAASFARIHQLVQYVWVCVRACDAWPGVNNIDQFRLLYVDTWSRTKILKYIFTCVCTLLLLFASMCLCAIEIFSHMFDDVRRNPDLQNEIDRAIFQAAQFLQSQQYNIPFYPSFRLRTTTIVGWARFVLSSWIHMNKKLLLIFVVSDGVKSMREWNASYFEHF